MRRTGFARAAPLALAALFAGLAAMSWRRWPDVLIDFGHQLYVPWRLADGAVLYRDLRWLYGPLSQYANAALFHLFGASFRVVFLADLAILAGVVTLLHRHLAATCDRLTAFLASAVVLAVFGFAQYVGIGNYDWASPYSHEATHGTTLAIAMLLVLAACARGEGTGRRLAAGALLGAIALTRPEIAVAAAAGALVFVLAAPVHRPGSILAGAAVPPILCALAFGLALPPGDALRAAAGGWTTLTGSSVATSPFFLQAMGFDRPAANMLVVLRGAAVAFAATAVAWWAARLAADDGRGWLVRAPAALVLAAVVGSAFVVDIVTLGRPFPALVLAGVGLVAWTRARTAWGHAHGPALAAALAFGVFAFVLSGKMLLNARIAHYGFYLAMPSAVFGCMVLCWLLPARLPTPRARALTRGAVVAFVVVLCGRYVHHSWTYFARKIFPIGAGADTIVSFARDGRAQPVTDALAWIERTIRPDETLTVLPEGVMLNFLTRRRSPSGFTLFMPTELAVFGEEAAVADLAAHPPDYVALVHRDAREFGVGPFGRDPRFGRRLMDWVTANYRPVARFGAEPFNPRDVFGIAILERIDRVPPAP